MQPSAHNFRNEWIAAANRETVLLAIAELGRATSGEILDHIRKKKRKSISKRAVQDWLSKLEEEGYIGRNNYNICHLTENGKDLRLFAETCGKTNFEHLFSIKLPGSFDEDLDELVRRFGLLIIWHFVSLILPENMRKERSEEYAFNMSWLANSIPIRLMFDAFMQRFGIKTNSKYYPYKIDDKTRDKLFSILLANYRSICEPLAFSAVEIMTDVLKKEKPDQEKQLKLLTKLMNEEYGEWSQEENTRA